MAPPLWGAWLAACGADGTTKRQPDEAPVDTGASVDGATSTATQTDDTGESGGTEPVVEPPYCRSLDPDWRPRYVEPIDDELASVIEAHGLLGDARMVVDEAGNCVWRSLPDLLEPMPQLGRSLFFSLDLSGDRDVSCATCHHPALGAEMPSASPWDPGWRRTR